ANGDRDVEEGGYRLNGSANLLLGLAGGFDVLRGGIYDAGQALEGLLRIPQSVYDRVVEEAELGVPALGVHVDHGLRRLLDSSDTREGITNSEIVVKERQRQAGHEGVDPHAHAREFDADGVDV